jgi:hypothetical protein
MEETCLMHLLLGIQNIGGMSKFKDVNSLIIRVVDNYLGASP